MLWLIHCFHKDLAVVLWLSWGWREIALARRPLALLSWSSQPPYARHKAALFTFGRSDAAKQKSEQQRWNRPSWMGLLSVRKINEQGPENKQWGPCSTFPNVIQLVKLAPFNRGAVIKVKRAPINGAIQTGLGVLMPHFIKTGKCPANLVWNKWEMQELQWPDTLHSILRSAVNIFLTGTWNRGVKDAVILDQVANLTVGFCP